MWFVLGVFGWLACAAFNAWAVWAEESKQGVVTRGGMFFVVLISVLGPVGLGAAFAALTYRHFSDWARRPAWTRNKGPKN